MAQQYGLHTFMSAKAASGIGLTLFIGDCDGLELNLDTVAGTDGTIKFQVSDSDNPPDFTATQSASNSWEYQQVIDQDTNTEVDGSTGITPAGVVHKKLRVNFNAGRWFNAIISGMSSGSYTLKGRGHKING